MRLISAINARVFCRRKVHNVAVILYLLDREVDAPDRSVVVADSFDASVTDSFVEAVRHQLAETEELLMDRLGAHDLDRLLTGSDREQVAIKGSGEEHRPFRPEKRHD